MRSFGSTGGTAGFGEICCGRWATATSDRTRREPGQPGVRLHCHLDVRQELNTQPPARRCSALTCHGRDDSRVRTLALSTGGLGGRHGAVTRALPELMLAAPVSDPALLPG
ncbi:MULTISPECIES: DUF6207 family protein [unclassified Streptomyces]|uniref:DUF6207 family protein n=1 Tax=unclassified Streptomyces TaxID=2593676 RepID=UPI000C6F2DF2|nr:MULTISPECIES: DUF6207 family protein [unclassified Streptomyces]